MGGSSKSQTVGYRYSLGAHLALCHGPVDAIREIRIDDRTAWTIDAALSQAQGGEIQALQSYGIVADASATPAGEMGSTATLTFSGAMPGMRLGASYDLSLSGDGTTITVTLRGIAYDPVLDRTTWQVEPATTAFDAQSATTTDAANLPSLNRGAAGGRIRINKPALFGGPSREGGIVGDIDVLMGGPAQGANDYLASRAGADVPGYRGICSLVLRQVYLGLNPYLKPWAVRVSRILTAQDGTAQWYPDTARIVPEVRVEGTAIYIAMDASGSMSGSRMGAQITAVSRLIDEIGKNNLAREDARPNDIQIVTYAAEVQSTILRRNADSTAYAELSDWLDGLSQFTNGGTDFGAAVSEAEAFFEGVGNSAGSKRRVLIFVTDGEPSPTSSVNAAKAILARIADLDVYAFNIALPNTAYTAEIDNTPADGVPIVPEGDPDALVASFRAGFGRDPDMNPAHIIRECLTNEDWGLGYSAADIGPSFAEAAETLFAESFGLSLLWQRESAIEDFIADVLSHIDAYLYINRRSGRWELRLIRDDYDPETIPVFNDTNIVDWGELGRREASDLINSLTLRYTDIRTDQTGTVSVSDTGLVQEFGQVISTTLDYPGIRHEALASRVAARDLQALSAPLLSGEITVTRAGADLDPGDVIALTSPERGLSNVIMRVAEMDLGDGRKNGIGLKLVEDVFALSSNAFVGGESSETGALIVPPKPLDRRWVAEAPYWLLVQELGHTQADARLEEDPDAGALVAIAERPSPDALSAQVWHDIGGGYEPLEPVEFAPTALLGEDLSENPEHRQVTVGGWQGLEDISTGTLASIGEELLRVDGVSPTTLTLGRGCLDTVPQAHAAGTPVIFWQALANATDPTFGAGEVISVKLLPETGFGTLPLAQAPEDTITMASRAIRPLPPGDVRANGQVMADINALNDGPLQLTWAHRDRLSQTSQIIDAHDAASIGPEPGVFYRLEIRWVDPDTDTALDPPAKVLEAGTGTSFAFLKEEIPTDQAPPLTKHIELSLRSHRTTGTITYGAWQARSMRFYMPDGLKLSGAEMWLGLGTGTDLEAHFVEAWADHSDLAPQNILGSESFVEHATTKAVSADRISIYIEVDP